MKRNSTSDYLPTTILIGAAVTFPALFYSRFEASSTAFGVALASLLCILAQFFYIPISSNHEKPSFPRRFSSIFLLIIFALIFHGIISLYLFGPGDVSRFTSSFSLLFFIGFGAVCLSNQVKITQPQQIHNSIMLIYASLTMCGLIASFSSLSLTTDKFTKTVLFFGEPSHYGLAYFPFLLYACITNSTNWKHCYILITALLALFLESLTLFVIVAAVVVLVSRLRVILAFSAFAAVVSIFVDLSYYTERLNTSSDNTNLSSLAYWQGWERALLSLSETNGFGVGFQQFGVVGSSGSITDEIFLILGTELNVLDGGSGAPKIIGEFGVIGLLSILFYLGLCMKSAARVRKSALCRTTDCKGSLTFYRSCILALSAELFVRGTGYFSTITFLFLCALVGLSRGNRYSRKP